MKIIHRYPIGKLIMMRRTHGHVVGQIRAYDENYYLIDWHGWVPEHYTGIVSEPEVARWAENFDSSLKRGDFTPAS